DLVSVTDGNGCTSPINGQVVISEFPTPVINPMSDESICEGDNLTIPDFTANPSGGQFTWTNAGTDVGFGTGNSGFIGSFTGNISSTTAETAIIQVDYLSANGCPAAPITFNVTVNPLPQVSFTG